MALIISKWQPLQPHKTGGSACGCCSKPRTAVWFFQLTDLLAAAHIVSQMTKGMAVCASSFDFICNLYTPQTVDRLREPSPLSLMLKRDTTQGQRVWKSLPFHFDKADIVPGSWGAKTLCLKYSCSLHGGQYHLNNIIFWNVFGC